jgi:hypothetical protein
VSPGSDLGDVLHIQPLRERERERGDEGDLGRRRTMGFREKSKMEDSMG